MSDILKSALIREPPTTEHGRAIGKLIRQYRRGHDMTLGELSKSLGLTTTQLSALERGRIRKTN